MSESFDPDAAASGLVGLRARTAELTTAATTFSRTMTEAFASSTASGQKFGDVLSTLGTKIASLAAKPSELPSIFSSVTNVKPFAAGGIIGTPSYFPMAGGTGLAGEAGAEAIMPLQRASDGSLGVAAQGGGHVIHVHIATPDAESFRRSESYVTGQIARAVARGQRSL